MTSPPQTSATESADGEVNLETVVQETGQPATIVRDGQGELVYPGYVPPAPQSPKSPEPSDANSPPSLGRTPRKTVTAPVSATKDKNMMPMTRPKMAERPATDAPGRVRRQSSAVPMPAIKRSGTNVSHLQQALWTSPYDEDDSSSSDMSTDEDEDLSADVERMDHAIGSKAQSQQFRRFRVANENYKTKGRVSRRDGRLAISIKDISTNGYLPNALGAAITKVVPLKEGEIGRKPEGEEEGEQPAAERTSSEAMVDPESLRCPPLNIVIMVIGSRGDAQPFLKIGKVLKEKYGHRVRIATHPAFREFVEKDSDLEFFSVGGDPSELMAFMVKNPGLIPTLETLRAGDIGRRRAAMNEMFGGFWRACVNATDDEKDVRNLQMMGERQPFVADAIIANPASFAHVHCAEALGIPLILSFTFPYTPTRSFPHPMANVKKSNVDPGYTNFMSYPLVEMMVWQGLGDLVNDLRVKTLGLVPVSTLWAPGSLYRLNVPFAYLWSPSLVPKPPDWGDEIDICGFVFLDLASSFKPPNPLEEFLSAGETPIYIGFGSIVVDDAEKFTNMIFEAVELAGVRALVSKGWGGLGGDSLSVPENIFLLENTPHDWLFPRVKACVIHGGAGTTAIALKCGKPTMVVPFFGDQFFWGNMIVQAKAGPESVPYKQLSAEKLAEGIKFCLTEEAQKNAQALARDIAREGDGAENMCAFFHNHLQLSGKHSMRCSILQDRVAVWHMKGTSLRLSALAADILVERGFIQWRKLSLVRHCEWNDFEGPGEPVTGVLGSVAGSLGEAFGGIGSVPSRIAKNSHMRREKKDKQRQKRETARRMKKGQALKDGHVGIPERKSETELNGNVTKDTNGTSQAQSREAGHTNDRRPIPRHTAASLESATTQDAEPDSWYVNEVSRGALQSAGALASAPIDLSVALAQGFHNAPRLYGDDTVRRPPRVTGLRSGLRAARTQFAYGIYDAWTGVVRLPVRGAKSGGTRGFAKGVGMGLSGLVLKDLAALTAPVGYTLMGLKKQLERRRQPQKQIRRARILQGQRELKDLGAEERRRRVEEVEKGWEVLRRLWETVEKREKDKGGLGAQIRVRRRRRGVGQAFESVEMANNALGAVKRGEEVRDAVKDYRRSEDLKKS
ncbi:family 1 glycosyltransferase [Cryphonectria parasitica EP155]|uniref:Family 1 glycosyltransferase n=1 Tax=Cryphonectria parasitica (strain ATCC 38755 / EP155) TaxID=660469 RepID=A0A9P4YBA2_CRYP1|nr:family 1 glycosyltransferase [Cryphonectria parasitica EP155]KAF3770191.1 family 1 glycosyltransferase [Cryphonectria parasitica EP155]